MTWIQKSPLEWELAGTTKRASWDNVKGQEALVVEDDGKQSCVIIPMTTLGNILRTQNIELQNSDELERSIQAVQELFAERQQLEDRVTELQAEVARKWEQCLSLNWVIKQERQAREEDEKTMNKAINLIDKRDGLIQSMKMQLEQEKAEKAKIMKIASAEIDKLRKLVP